MVTPAEIADALLELGDIATTQGNVYKARAFYKAAGAMKSAPDDDIEYMPPGIGAGIAKRIREFRKTGKIVELEQLRKSRDVVAFDTFGKIIGVGPATIREWIKLGLYTLADLRKAIAKRKVTLTAAQRLGLLYYCDLNERIPRDEVTKLGGLVLDVLRDVSVPGGLRAEISGSYRRGAATSGDVDIISTSQGESLIPSFQTQIEDDPDFIAATSAGKQRITFLYRSPWSGKVRQVDILWVPPESYWTAICYFTGSGPFNEYMRGVARKKGFRLNQNGLYRVKAGSKSAHLGEQVPIHSERDIFTALGIDYRPPEARQ